MNENSAETQRTNSGKWEKKLHNKQVQPSYYLHFDYPATARGVILMMQQIAIILLGLNNNMIHCFPLQKLSQDMQAVGSFIIYYHYNYKT